MIPLICNTILFACVLLLSGALMWHALQRRRDLIRFIKILESTETLIEAQEKSVELLQLLNKEADVFITWLATIEKEIIKLKAEKEI